jgi:hypothetical protein
VVKAYNNKCLESKILRHRLLERVGEVYRSVAEPETKKRKLNKLNQEARANMKNAEKKCRKIKLGTIPFSPEAAKWIRRLQVYLGCYSLSKGICLLDPKMQDYWGLLSKKNFTVFLLSKKSKSKMI